jgi:hypothetical protein
MVAAPCTHHDSVTIDRDPACFTVIQNDSSRKVTEKRAECMGPDSIPQVEIHPQVATAVDAQSVAPTTSGEALHLAIKLAVDSGEYERAAALLEVAKTTMPRSGLEK